MSGRITSTLTRRSYMTPDWGSCGSKNIVYLVTCIKCSKQYVGETGNSINKCFYQHMYEIRYLKNPELTPPSLMDKPPTPMPKHFAQANYSVLDMKIQVLEYIKLFPNHSNTVVYRRNHKLH